MKRVKFMKKGFSSWPSPASRPSSRRTASADGCQQTPDRQHRPDYRGASTSAREAHTKAEPLISQPRTVTKNPGK